MSIDFKKLVDVDSTTEIEDGDYLLTIHDGEVVKVAKDDAKLGGVFIVNVKTIYSTSPYTYTCDKTVNEIVEAAQKSAVHVVLNGHKTMELAFFSEDQYCVFYRAGADYVGQGFYQLNPLALMLDTVSGVNTVTELTLYNS